MKKYILVLLFIPAISFSQGKLKKAKEELTEKTATSSSSTNASSRANSRTNRRSSANKSARTSFFDSFTLELLYQVSIGMFIGDLRERDLNPYPYFYDNEGEYAAELSESGRKQNIKLATNYAFNNPSAFQLSAMYKPMPILGIEASYTHFSENTIQGKEVLDLSSLMLNYYRVREKNIAIWWGLGVSHVGNEVNEYGFTYSIGTEIYLIKPFSLHVSWQESLINWNTVSVLKAQVKYHLKNTAVFLGYHRFTLGSQKIGAPALGVEFIF